MQASKTAAGEAEALAALRLESVLLAAPGSPFLDTQATTDNLIHHHFLHFAKLFHASARSEALPALCRSHLQAWPLTITQNVSISKFLLESLSGIMAVGHRNGV